MEIKLFNNIKNSFENHTVKKIDIKNLPYRLAYEKFIIKNGFSLNQSFFNDGKLHLAFDKIYSL